MSRDLNHLHPNLRPLCEAFIQQCSDDGIEVLITFTYRSNRDQDILYAKGRTVKGRKVTNAKGGQSKHNFTIDGKPASKAFDFVITDPKTDKPVWQTTDVRWIRAVAIGKHLGLTSGADFKTLKDFGHMEIK
jgi:peptidoglycan L-alanyl-D-glutamate endopeptidase CwlK